MTYEREYAESLAESAELLADAIKGTLSDGDCQRFEEYFGADVRDADEVAAEWPLELRVEAHFGEGGLTALGVSDGRLTVGDGVAVLTVGGPHAELVFSSDPHVEVRSASGTATASVPSDVAKVLWHAFGLDYVAEQIEGVAL